MPRPPRIPSSDGPDREIPASVRAKCEGYRDKHLAIVWEEFAIRGITVMPQSIIDSANDLVENIEREGEHARGLRATVRSDPPDPDRAPDRETDEMRRQRERAWDKAFGDDAEHPLDCTCKMCATAPGILGRRRS